MPVPDAAEAIEIVYTVRFDVSADGLCAMTGFCDCEVVYRGGGVASLSKRPPGLPQTYVGSWAKASGNCHEAFELWVPPDGKAHHSLTLGSGGNLTEWVAHRDADPTRKTADIKAGGQVWLSALNAPFVDGLATHNEDAAGDLGGIGLASHHKLEVRRSQGQSAKAPSGNTTAVYQASYTFVGEAPGTCAARGTCPCEVLGEFRGEPQVVADPATIRSWKGTWTPGPSTCKAYERLWTIPPGEALLVVEPATGPIATATLMPWLGDGVQNDNLLQSVITVTSAPPSPQAKGAATLKDLGPLPMMMIPVGPGEFARVQIERSQTLTLKGLAP